MPCNSLPWAWGIRILDMAIPMFWMLIYAGTHLPTLSIKPIFQHLSGCLKPPLLNLWFNALYTLMSVLTASCVCNFCSLMYDRKPRMDFFLLISIEQIEDTLLSLASSQNSVFFPIKSTTSAFLLKEPFCRNLVYWFLSITVVHSGNFIELWLAKRWAVSQRSGTRE